MAVEAKTAADWSPKELETWSSVATLLEWLPNALDAQLVEESNMSHFEFGILYALSKADGLTLSMSQIAGFANSSLSRLSRAATRLQKNGWITRAQNPLDRRATLATLTADGINAVTRALPGHVGLVRRVVFDSLTPAQLNELKSIAESITGAIKSDGTWTPS